LAGQALQAQKGELPQGFSMDFQALGQCN